LTTKESNANIDASSLNYQGGGGGGQKKPSILGKLKDKTKKARSKIESKVGKNKGGDDEDDDVS
jgi:hypothetical protein